MAYSYRCTEYPGMEGCAGAFVAATKEEVRSHVEMHARQAHDEEPSEWSDEERRQVEDLIRET